MSMIRAQKRGFTVVELLVVIVVIAILAAITIIVHGEVRNGAHDTAVQAELSEGLKQLEIKSVRGLTNLSATELKFGDSAYDEEVVNLIFVHGHTVAGEQYYGLIAQSKSGERFFVHSRSAVAVPYEGPWPQSNSDWDTFNYLYDFFSSSGGSMQVGYGRGPGLVRKW